MHAFAHSDGRQSVVTVEESLLLCGCATSIAIPYLINITAAWRPVISRSPLLTVGMRPFASATKKVVRVCMYIHTWGGWQLAVCCCCCCCCGPPYVNHCFHEKLAAAYYAAMLDHLSHICSTQSYYYPNHVCHLLPLAAQANTRP